MATFGAKPSSVTSFRPKRPSERQPQWNCNPNLGSGKSSAGIILTSLPLEPWFMTGIHYAENAKGPKADVVF
jgi:hypothetical protein